MNYLGSKLTLLPEIEGMIRRHGVPTQETFCDLFAGTTIVSQLAKRMGFQVYSNDCMRYSFAMQSTFVTARDYPEFKGLDEIIRRHVTNSVFGGGGSSGIILHSYKPLSWFGLGPVPEHLPENSFRMICVLHYLERMLPPVNGKFVEEYCEGGSAGRLYFSCENGMLCQAIGNQIAAWRNQGMITPEERQILTACLVESMDAVANTASVYGAHLKQLKLSAQKPLRLKVPLIQPSALPHQSGIEDATSLVRALGDRRMTLLYLDPPYNERPYDSNYHVLETIARWDLDEFTPRGKTGQRPRETRSSFSSKREAESALGELIANANFDHLLMSYSTDGIVPMEKILDMLQARCPHGVCEFRAIPYPRFRADRDSEKRRYDDTPLSEYLLYVRTC